MLKQLSLDISPREKLTICGPSGCGKTSLIMALLQIIEAQKGRIIIDGRDLSTIERNDARLPMNVIPQESFFMPGITRFNISPRNRVPDQCIESAIRKVGLWKRFSSNGGLDMETSASDWSSRERQLLALTQAITSQSPILILDEATSRCVDCSHFRCQALSPLFLSCDRGVGQ
jgi:ATP-binding cassette subfamily C (CFTR/MRP) protein 1